MRRRNRSMSFAIGVRERRSDVSWRSPKRGALLRTFLMGGNMRAVLRLDGWKSSIWPWRRWSENEKLRVVFENMQASGHVSATLRLQPSLLRVFRGGGLTSPKFSASGRYQASVARSVSKPEAFVVPHQSDGLCALVFCGVTLRQTEAIPVSQFQGRSSSSRWAG